MKYRIEIEIDHSSIDCNPGPLVIETQQSIQGAYNLAMHLKSLFPRVALFKDISKTEYVRLDADKSGIWSKL